LGASNAASASVRAGSGGPIGDGRLDRRRSASSGGK
jgi:hypothetical protein